MNFMVILGPVIWFLLDKYKNTIIFEMEELEILNRLNNGEILDRVSSKLCIQILNKVRAYLIANGITTRLPALKKIIGDGDKSKGFLNLLEEQGHSIYMYLYQTHFSKEQLRLKLISLFGEDFTDLRIISPLNLDDYNELCNFFQIQMKLPIYPVMFTVLTSKLLLNLFFSPYIPRCFYFPERILAIDYVDKIQDICDKENLRMLILKDEFDVDLQTVIPYQISPINMIDHVISIFYEKIQGILNYGGLLIQELVVSDKTINILKTHFFRKVIDGAQIQEKVVLKPFSEGGSLESLIDNVTFNTIDMSLKFGELFNSILEHYYGDLFSNFDTILSQNQFYVIDMNSVSNNFSLPRIPQILDSDHFFKVFISEIISTKNETKISSQVKFRHQIVEFYNKIRQLGPLFFSTDKFITLKDGNEFNIKEFLTSNFSKEIKWTLN